MRNHKLPPNTDTNNNPLFPPIIDDPLQYVDTSDSLIPFTQINPPPLTWLWSQLIPIGSLTLLEAPASLGKSTFLLTLAAHLSSSLPLPDSTTGLLPDPSSPNTPITTDPAPIVLITPDDSASARSHTFLSQNSSRPDLLYSFTNITISHIHSGDRVTRPFSFTSTDLDILTREIVAIRPKLVIIDPFTSTLDSDPPLTEAKLSSLLARLNHLAATLQFACILARTITRPGQGTRLQRSIQPLLKAATAFTLTPDPLDPDHILLVQTKSTYARPAPILRFHIAPHPSNPSIPSIIWDGLSDIPRSELATLQTSTLAPTRQHIYRILAQHHTPVALSTLAEALPKISYDLLRRTLRRMLDDHQVASPSRGLYSLPPQPSSHSQVASHHTDPLPAESLSFDTSPALSMPTHVSSPTTSPLPLLSQDSVTSVTFSTLPDHQSLLTTDTLSQPPVTFSTSPDHQSLLTTDTLSQPPVTFSTSPDHQNPLTDTSSHYSTPLPQSLNAVTSPISPASNPLPLMPSSSQNPPHTPLLPGPATPHTSLRLLSSPPTTHRASITSHTLANSCSDLPNPYPAAPPQPHNLTDHPHETDN